VPKEIILTDYLGLVDYSPPTSPFQTSTLKQAVKCAPLLSQADFCYVEDQADEDGIYINLLQNPERFTGYAGESAARVWNAIYNENCFGGDYASPVTKPKVVFGPIKEEVCFEEKIFYNLISGLHSSISLHICGDYFDMETETWSRNLTCSTDRFIKFPERIDNLYFVWSVMVRAVSKLTPYLENYPLCHGSGDEEFITVSWIK